MSKAQLFVSKFGGELRHMTRMIGDGSSDPVVIAKAREVAARAHEDADREMVKAIGSSGFGDAGLAVIRGVHEWLRKRFELADASVSTEFRTPRQMIQMLETSSMRIKSDSNEATVLLLAMLESLEFVTTLKLGILKSVPVVFGSIYHDGGYDIDVDVSHDTVGHGTARSFDSVANDVFSPK